MENAFYTSLPLVRRIFPVGQPRQYIGAGISFCVHTMVVCCIYFLGPGLADFKPPLVIDFSIEQADNRPKTQKAVPRMRQEVLPPPVPVREEVILPETSIPEKIETVEVPKIVPLEQKKEVAEKIVQQPVMPDKIESEETEPEEIVSEPVTADADVVEDDREEPPSAHVSTRANRQENSLSFQKQKYIKEHFAYIKAKVQRKIVYPPIARRMGWEGKVLVSFVICLDGSVKDLHIRESSGHQVLDKNAIDIIRKEAPFPQPPVSAELIIPIVYKLS